MASDEVATDEYVQNAGYEGYLLAQGHRRSRVPLLPQALNPMFHATAVLVELFVGSRDAFLPFSDDAILGIHRARLELLTLLFNLIFLEVYSSLKLLESLGQGEVVEQVEDGKMVQGGKRIPVILV